jgi:hypothetical protein
MSSFSIIKPIDNIIKNITDIKKLTGIIIPDINSIGFSISNPVLLLENTVSFLEKEIINIYGYPYITEKKVTGTRIHDPITNLNKKTNKILNYLVIIQNTSFEFTITTNVSTPSFTITTGDLSVYTYNYTIEWGDGNMETNVTGNTSHDYNDTGDYTIKIKGVFPNINLINNLQIKSIKSLGNVGWKKVTFRGCANLISVNTIGVTTDIICSNGWQDCTSLKEFNTIGLKNVTNITNTWLGCTSLTTFNTLNLTKVERISKTWEGCTSLKEFNTIGLNNVDILQGAWIGCTDLVTFNSSGLTKVTNCFLAWKDCTSLKLFDAIGLINMTDSCVDAWKNTGPWFLNGNNPTFINWSKIAEQSPNGWNPGNESTNNPQTADL